MSAVVANRSVEVFGPKVASPESPTFAVSSLTASKLLIAVIAVAAFVHLIAAGSVALGNDEAYTVANARIVSLSYVDYPPLHVWLVGVWSAIAHSEAPLVVRLPFMALFAGSTWLMYSLTALLFDQRAGFWAAVMFNLAPVFAVAHSSWVLPDGPLLFFLLCSALVIAKLVLRSPHYQFEIYGWIGVGVLAGAALLTKYHALFLIAGTFTFLLTCRPNQAGLNTPGPWIAGVIALLMFVPVIYWNAAHGWLGLFFQSARLTKHTSLSITRVVANVGEQAAYLSPWLFAPLAVVLYQALRQGPQSQETWFLALLACGPIVSFTAASLFAKGLPHWSMPGWLFAFPLLGKWLEDWERRRPRSMHLFVLISIALTAFLLILFIAEARYGWITSSETMRAAEHNPTLDLLDWRKVGLAVAERKLIDAATPAIAGTSWMTAGKLNYVVGRKIPVLCICNDPQQFRFLHKLNAFSGRNVIIVETPWQYAHGITELGKMFRRIELLPPVILDRQGNSALKLMLLHGTNFSPPSENGVAR